MQNKTKSAILDLTTVAVFVAIGTALSFLTVQIPVAGILGKQISINLICIYLVAFLYKNPLWAMGAGFAIDFLSTILNSSGGAYNPAFSVAHVLAPLMMWFLFNVLFKKIRFFPVKIPLTVFLVQALIYVPVNSLMLWLFFDSSRSLWAWFMIRIPYLAVDVPALSLLLIVLYPLLLKIKKRHDK